MDRENRKSRLKPKDLNLTLLENGLDYILSALEGLSEKPEPNPRHIKYAVIHLAAGAELLLKERLQREHWSLVFDKLENAKKDLFETGDFQSANFSVCLSRLRDICGVELKLDHRDRLLRLRDKRNQLEHYGIIDSARAAIASACGVVSILLDFIHDELKPEKFQEAESALVEQIRSKLKGIGPLISQRWNEIRKKVDQVSVPVTTCPSCTQDAALIDGGVDCLYCRYTDTAEKAADLYVSSIMGISHYSLGKDGGEWPVYECPECKLEALVDRSPESALELKSRYVCFSCGAEWENHRLNNCVSCGRFFPSRVENGGVCDDCVDQYLQDDERER